MTPETNTASRVEKSMRTWRRALELIPGGNQLISRRPSRFAHGVSPVYADRAKGARFWDIDGHEYIDWVSGIGSIILGYADPVVDEAVKEQIGRGLSTSVNCDLEVELAEELVRLIPCAEMVRYAKCGGEACAVAVRIARGTTGRDKILFSGYHGWHDWYLAANLCADAALDAHLFPGIEPIGVPQQLEGTAWPFPYGDLDALSALLDKHRGEVAAVMMEPMRSETPAEGYLDGVQALARDHGALLVFDEVSTGFRPSTGGAQKKLGVTPDMAVFAKSISNGYPMGAVVGTREAMEPASRMFISSTYFSDAIGLRAALTNLKEVEKRDVPGVVHATGRELTRRLNAVAEETAAPVTCGGVEYHPHLEFQIDDAEQRAQATTLYVQEMAKRGCHGYAGFYLNAAQGPAEIDQTVDAARQVFPIIVEGLAENRLGDLLECSPQQDAFRRIVR